MQLLMMHHNCYPTLMMVQAEALHQLVVHL